MCEGSATLRFPTPNQNRLKNQDNRKDHGPGVAVKDEGVVGATAAAGAASVAAAVAELKAAVPDDPEWRLVGLRVSGWDDAVETAAPATDLAAAG